MEICISEDVTDANLVSASNLQNGVLEMCLKKSQKKLSGEHIISANLVSFFYFQDGVLEVFKKQLKKISGKDVIHANPESVLARGTPKKRAKKKNPKKIQKMQNWPTD